jgi:phage minor structural protein
MKPILFAPSATTFNTNGLGRLNFISCTVTEERNGMYVLEGTIAEDELHASALEMNSIILAKPNHSSANQAFRVHKIVKPMKGIYSISAEHISYQLSYIPAMPFAITAGSSACANTLAALKSNAAESCPFTFWTDVTTVASYKQTAPASIRSRLGGVEGSVLDQFGGEYEWDNYTVKLHRQRGVQTPNVTLRYGKNIIDLEQEKEINNTITGVCPFWVDSEGNNLVTLTEKTVDSSTASSYPFKRTVPLDMSGDWEEAPTESQLRTRAQAYVNASGIGIPKVSIKVSFVNLPDTEEYKDVAALQSVNLCDYVSVQFEKLGINVAAKVVKTVYNVLTERYDSIEVGALRSSLAGTISDQNSEIQGYIDNTRTMFKNFDATIQDDIAGATNWLTSADGYVMARKDASSHWKELLFMDTNDASTAHNVLRINQNGIGFSSNGVNGPFTQAWTLDGKLVIGGTNVPSFTVYDSSNNIIFQTSRSGTIWNSTNSSMSANGTITATSAVLASCTITNGSLTITSGNTTIFSVSSSGITWNLPNSSMTSNGTLTASNATINGDITSVGSASTCKIQNGKISFYQNGVSAEKSYVDSSISNGRSTIRVMNASNGGIQITNWLSSSSNASIDIGFNNQNIDIESSDAISIAADDDLSITSSGSTLDIRNDAYSGSVEIATADSSIQMGRSSIVLTSDYILIDAADDLFIRTNGSNMIIENESLSGGIEIKTNGESIEMNGSGDINLVSTGHVYANGRRID